MVVASWIVTAASDRLEEVRARIDGVPGARVGGRSDPIVVSTECGDGEMGRVQQRLAEIPGVVSVAMVIACRETDEEVPR